MDRITTTIKRRWLSEIIDGTKTTEYREMKPYWINKLDKVKVPFELRLINGMQKQAPEVTVQISKITRNKREKVFELHIDKIINYDHWDKRRKQPKSNN